jgi:hypothetical protein
MGYYDNGPPRHAHRTPAELAEDEIIAAFRDTVRFRAAPPLSAVSDTSTPPKTTNRRQSEVGYDNRYGYES